jgi:hypothetical protein
MVLTPVAAAPKSMAPTADSLSACTKRPPLFGSSAAKNSVISLWGVIG